MTTRNRIITETNEFLLAINLARSEALKVGGQVSIQLADPTNANNEVGPGFCVVDGNPGPWHLADRLVIRNKLPCDARGHCLK